MRLFGLQDNILRFGVRSYFRRLCPYYCRGDFMPDHKEAVNNLSDGKPFLRLEPEKRMCPIFDPVTIAKFQVAEPEDMGFRVLDNFCEEHIL